MRIQKTGVWCTVNTHTLSANLRSFRRHLGPDMTLAVAVKSNGYGHGILLAAQAFLAGGADWVCVHALEEAATLRTGGITAPIYVMGPVFDLEHALDLDLRLVVYTAEQVARLVALGRPQRLHLKIETGNHRQGVELPEALILAAQIAAAPHLTLEGVTSHFANAGDTDRCYALAQLARFSHTVDALRAAGHPVPIRHISNSAATLVWPSDSHDMVRVGIAAYGLWPSKETHLSTMRAGHPITLSPALTWKTRVAQVKKVPTGALVGYGCTWQAPRPTVLAILPVGYADGYDRGLSNVAYVLVRGQRAPVRGRVCMNLIMVDITEIPGVILEDDVVLLGTQGEETISAELMADWADTINYEIVARVSTHLVRITESAPDESPDPPRSCSP